MVNSSNELISKRREEIIDACEELYQALPYSEITLKEISKFTSFSRPTIYNYFRSREEIFLALTVREFDRWNAELRVILAEDEGLRIDELADKIARSLEDRSQLLELLSTVSVLMTDSGREELTAFYQASFGDTMDLLQLMLNKFCPWMPRSRDDMFIYTFFSFLFGLNTYTGLVGSHRDLAEGQGIDNDQQTVYSLVYNCITGLLISSDLNKAATKKGDIMLKTKVNRLFDYRDLDIGTFRDTMSEEELKEEMENEIKKDLLTARVFTEKDTAEKGDVAELRLISRQPKFNRGSIKLNLGLGLFSKELEDGIIGHRRGESFDLVIDGITVSAEILSLKRRMPAELNDSFAAALGIPGVTTKDEYLSYVRNKYIDFFAKAYVEFHAMDIFDEAMAESDIEYAEEDIRLFMRDQEGDEIPDMDSFEAEDAKFILNLYIMDCMNRGTDYQTSDIKLDSKDLTDLRDRVLKPIEEYIKDKCTFEIVEDKNGSN